MISRKKLRVLHIIDTVNLGGIASVVLNLFDEIKNDKDFIFDFLVYIKPDEDIKKYIEQYGGRIYVCKPFKKLGPILYVNTVREIIRNNGPYVAVHAHTAHLIGYALKAAKKEGVKVRVGHAHGRKVLTTSGIICNPLLPIFRINNKKYATDLLACVKESGDSMFGQRYDIFPNTLNIDKFNNINKDEIKSLKLSLGISDKSKIIGFVGKLGAVKNPLFLSEFLLELKKARENVVLIVVGDGELKLELEDKLKEYNLTEYVRFIGWQKDVVKWINMIDILIMPSFSEGAPMSMLEAQACGKGCLVSSNISRDNDINLNKVRFCNLENMNEWISGYYSLLSVSDIEKECIYKAFESKELTTKISIGKLKSIYNKCL